MRFLKFTAAVSACLIAFSGFAADVQEPEICDNDTLLDETDQLMSKDERDTERPMYINSAQVILRELTSKNSKRLTFLKKGELVSYLGLRLKNEGVEWIQIAAGEGDNRLEGWIDSRYAGDDKPTNMANQFKDLDYSPQKKIKEYPNNPRVKTRGVYITVYSATKSNIKRFFTMADNGDVNTFVVDVKNAEGEILFKSKTAEKYFPDANKRTIYKSTPPFIEEAKKKGIYLIARVTAFKDNYFALANPQHAIGIPGSSELFKDRDGQTWVSAYDRYYWDYIVDLSIEAAELGFNEIQFDYVRFPDVPRDMELRNTKNEKKAEAIQNFLKYAYEKLSKYQVYVAADIFGLVGSAGDDMNIGQYWEAISNVIDYVCPMMYPSHYANGFAGIKIPDTDPYKTILNSASDSVRRQKNIPTPAIIRPWIQDFTAIWVKGHIDYTSKEVLDQIKALKDTGIDEYLLWNPKNRYNKLPR